MKSIKDAVGKRIASVEVIRAEFGRTYDTYVCLTFDDGAKAMFATVGHGDELYNPRPPIEEMKKAPKFFSPEDIAAAVLANEQQRRQVLAFEKEP